MRYGQMRYLIVIIYSDMGENIAKRSEFALWDHAHDKKRKKEFMTRAILEIAIS
jgi:hypothetical protein